MNDEKMPEGLCRLGQIFWRVEAQGPEPSEGLKLILEEMRRKRSKTLGCYHDLLNLMDIKGGVALTDWDGRPAVSLNAVDAFAILKPGDYWTRVDGPDVRETSKLCFTDQWSRMFKSFGKPVAEAADWYGNL